MKKINPFLWFDFEAEQAAKFYVGFLRIRRSGRSRVMAKKPPKKPVDRRDPS